MSDQSSAATIRIGNWRIDPAEIVAWSDAYNVEIVLRSGHRIEIEANDIPPHPDKRDRVLAPLRALGNGSRETGR